jgi:hypothetical protein
LGLHPVVVDGLSSWSGAVLEVEVDAVSI